jgi:hypothetical protein
MFFPHGCDPRSLTYELLRAASRRAVWLTPRLEYGLDPADIGEFVLAADDKRLLINTKVAVFDLSRHVDPLQDGTYSNSAHGVMQAGNAGGKRLYSSTAERRGTGYEPGASKVARRIERAKPLRSAVHS